MISNTLETKDVSKISCSQDCINTIKLYREQQELLIRQIEDLKYEGYTLRKAQKPLKEKLEAQTKDYKRIQEEYSIKSAHYRFAQADIAKLTAELDALKAKYEDAEFNFKKFDVSSTVVESMIENHLKYRTQDTDKKGLGYNSVPPPFNDNYTPPLETEELETPMEYGKPTATVSVETEQSSQSGSEQVNVTNVSTSCAGEQLVDDGHKQDKMNSKTNKPVNFVKSSDKCSCSCGNSLKQNQTRTKSQSFGPGPSPNYFYLKRQTCFNCGIPGHIARNCPHRPYVPYYVQGWQNVPRGRSSKRNPSRSRSSDGNWNENKAKRQKARDKKDKTPDSRDAFTKPTWVRSKSSQGSSHSSHLKTKPKSKGSPISKSSVDAPIRSNHNLFKPNYRWVPKGSMSKTNKDPVISVHSISDQQDMSWESVSSVDSNGIPSVKMDWVPKTN